MKVHRIKKTATDLSLLDVLQSMSEVAEKAKLCSPYSIKQESHTD